MKEIPVEIISMLPSNIHNCPVLGLMDFQYLPMEKTSDGKFESVYDSVVPKDIVPFSWLNEEAPLCMIPAFFCRTDSMQVNRNESTDMQYQKHTSPCFIYLL